MMMLFILSCCQVDAMKVSVKEFKKEYKKVNIDQIEVRVFQVEWAVWHLIFIKIFRK